jgi:predicted nucleic acid-binding protein
MERAEEIVVDASVAVKWFSEEEGSDKALELRNGHIDGKTTLIAPDLLVYEVANALRFKPGLNPQLMVKALDDLFGLQIDLMAPSSELVRRGSEIAFEYEITAYDSCYLSLGEILGTEVVTADDKLYEKAKGCGFLRLL